MLALKCVICLDVLRNLEREPLAAPCGHIYCRTCMNSMSRTREKTNCALCRLPFPVAAVVKLFVQYDGTQETPMPPLVEFQKEAGGALITACESVGEDAEENEVLQTVVSAENLLLELFETHGNTETEKLLKSISTSLEDLRKRLKLFSRVNALQQMNTSLTQERDTLRQAVIDQLREADEAANTQSKLNRRLKRTSSELETYQNRERSEQRATALAMQDLTDELQKERVRSAKFQKKYYATFQELKAAKVRDILTEVEIYQPGHGQSTGMAMSETELSDDSLEITPPPDSQGQSVAKIEQTLENQINTAGSTSEMDDSKGKRKVVARDRDREDVGRNGGRARWSQKRVKSTSSAFLRPVPEVRCVEIASSENVHTGPQSRRG